MDRPWPRRPKHDGWLYAAGHGMGYCWQWCRWRGALLRYIGHVSTRLPADVMALRYGGLPVKKYKVEELRSTARPAFAAMGASCDKMTNLKAALTDASYDDGTPRQPPVIIITPRNGSWSIMVKEPGLGLICRTEAASLAGLWVALDTYLGLPDIPWEIDPRASVPYAKKGKK